MSSPKIHSVLIITAYTWPYAFGGGRNAYSFFQFLIRSGYRAKMLCYSGARNPFVQSTITGAVQVAWLNQNLIVKVVSLLWIIPISLYYGFSSSLVIVVGAHFVGTPFAVLAAKLFNRKVIFRSTLLGDDDPETLIKDKTIRGIFRRYVLVKCDGYMAISHSFASHYVNLYGNSKPIIRTTQGIDLDRFNLTIRSKHQNNDRVPLRIIMVGSLIERKEYKAVFSVLSELKVPFNLIVVSNNYFPVGSSIVNEKDSIISYGREQLEDKLTFCESVENIESLYGNTDILIHNAYFEGIPNVVMESMACGVIPVVRGLPGFKDSLIVQGYSGFLFSNIEEINPILTYLYENIEERLSLSQSTSLYAQQNFSFIKTWQEINKTLGYV